MSTRQTRLSPVRWLLLAAVAFCAAGCQWPHEPAPLSYDSAPPDPQRDTRAAMRHNAQAVGHLRADRLDEAETELRKALAADLFFGPAHNNLGTVHFRRERHYEAAWELQYAAKLMARKPEPRNNLGMVFEAVGRLDEAARWYEEAVELAPENPEPLANLARIYVRANRRDDRTRHLLADVALKDDRPDWSAWAREQLALMGGAPRPVTTQPATNGPGN